MSLKNRKNYIGGSDVPPVLSTPPYGCARRLWYEKVGQEPDFPQEENYHMRRGTVLEPLVLKLYKAKTKRKLEKIPMLTKATHPFICAHMDAIVKNDGAPVEVKCPSMHSFKKIEREQDIPESYVLQLQHYINFTNADYGSFAIFSAETANLLIFDVPRDQKLIDIIVQAEIEFWEKVQKAVAPDRLPIIDKRCQTCHWRITCQNLVIDLPIGEAVQRPDLASLVEDFKQARELRKDAEEYFKETHNCLKEKLGDTQIAEAGGSKIYFTVQEQYRWNLEKLEKDHPELTKDYKQKTVIRPLRIF